MSTTFEVRIGSRIKDQGGFHVLDDAKKRADDLRAGRPSDQTPILVVIQATGEVVYEAAPTQIRRRE